MYLKVFKIVRVSQAEGKQQRKQVEKAFVGIYDMKAFGPRSQSGSNACSGQHNCSHICVSAPNGGFRCRCPDDMKPSASGDCVCNDGAKN